MSIRFNSISENGKGSLNFTKLIAFQLSKNSVLFPMNVVSFFYPNHHNYLFEYFDISKHKFFVTVYICLNFYFHLDCFHSTESFPVKKCIILNLSSCVWYHSQLAMNYFLQLFFSLKAKKKIRKSLRQHYHLFKVIIDSNRYQTVHHEMKKPASCKHYPLLLQLLLLSFYHHRAPQIHTFKHYQFIQSLPCKSPYAFGWFVEDLYCTFIPINSF